MLRRLTIRDFRNFERVDADIPEGGLAIVGENGHGKTNFLEAISYLALLRSSRGARDADVVRFGAPAFHVRAELAPPAAVREVSVAYERATKRKKAVLDNVEHSRLSDALATLPSVCFSPIDVALVAGGPADRRRYLDVTLALSLPRYLAAAQQYRGALRQRNAALRAAQRSGTRGALRGPLVGGADSASHEPRVVVWEPMLAQHGAVLAAARERWCVSHAATFSALCAAIGEHAPVTMRYASGGERTTPGVGVSRTEQEFATAYTAAFEQQRGHELRRGVTLVGPHRDELQLLLGARELRTFGSAGQQRSAAIALRMLELETLRDAIGATPLLLLDDPFAELDTRRSTRILGLLEDAGVGQVLIAVPRPEDIPAAFTRLERRTMENGMLR
jgi:DNA replication and repair protein RecF